MDKRIEIILNLISDGIGCADVGTDHGFVPIELYKRGYKGNIIATDINPLPLNTAINNAHKLSIDRIRFILTNGLDSISPDDVDTIVIAGMGADMICDIIDRAEWTMSSNYHLILQPMTKIEVLRYWLVNNGYNICKEVCVGKYTILSVRFSGQNEAYNDIELMVGKNPSKEIYLRKLKAISKNIKSKYYFNVAKLMQDDISKRYI